MCCISFRCITYLAGVYSVLMFFTLIGMQMIALVGLNAPNLIKVHLSDTSLQLTAGLNTSTAILDDDVKMIDIFDYHNGLAIGFWNYLVDGFARQKHISTLNKLLMVNLVMKIICLMTIPLLFIGAKTSKRRYLIPWRLCHTIVLIFGLSTFIYMFIFHLDLPTLRSLEKTFHKHLSAPTRQTGDILAMMFVTVAVSEGGPINLSILALLLVLVSCTERSISRRKSLQLFKSDRHTSEMNLSNQWEMQLRPFTLPRAKLDDDALKSGTCIHHRSNDQLHTSSLHNSLTRIPTIACTEYLGDRTYDHRNLSAGPNHNLRASSPHSTVTAPCEDAEYAYTSTPNNNQQKPEHNSHHTSSGYYDNHAYSK